MSYTKGFIEGIAVVIIALVITYLVSKRSLPKPNLTASYLSAFNKTASASSSVRLTRLMWTIVFSNPSSVQSFTITGTSLRFMAATSDHRVDHNNHQPCRCQWHLPRQNRSNPSQDESDCREKKFGDANEDANGRCQTERLHTRASLHHLLFFCWRHGRVKPAMKHLLQRVNPNIIWAFRS